MSPYLEKKIKELSFTTNIDKTRIELLSTLVPFILSTEIFEHNPNVRELTDKLLLKKELKDYLFKSRTQIVARIVREIQGFSEEQLYKNIIIFKDFYSENLDTPSEEKKKKVKLLTNNELRAEERILKTMKKYSRNRDK
ncbi:hypothetical protein [Liquorilactobacillus mali]|uniref:Uncharacterized protein n=1 Tax=Liquorilactobacillus mali KCTC 3596 = DSM 20444 TaxID=1046596 RepID=J0UQI5_9LACO|nr:hypothetical protein [Liquorilactobacillus mali]EJE98219.1 hypothetical protein LMA_08088 [Liquorilactobacillus mali KCTC 3596 = DSM 20444]KRN07907.1 hypothetical protein FD00_GL002498 [Liquorilactobacillus mali KCTC 3596 = DSM 20444]QFQ75012.1 hypothetical protein LM596_07710 [Liquorilactobacillus mali]